MRQTNDWTNAPPNIKNWAYPLTRLGILFLSLAFLGAHSSKSPVYPPLQRQLDGTWASLDHKGETLEFRPSKPKNGTAFVWFKSSEVDRKPYQIITKDRIAFAGHAYRVQFTKGVLILSVPKGFPGHSSLVRKYRSLRKQKP
jgi:hypothetical protein